MISRTHRFHGHSSLRFVYQRGQTVRGEHCALRYVRNEKRKNYRIAVVVSRKVSKSAVLRNRVRRRIYEIVRTQAENITGPYDFVFVVYDEALSTMLAQEVKRIIVGQLKKAGLVLPQPSANRPKGDTIALKESKTKDVYNTDRPADL